MFMKSAASDTLQGKAIQAVNSRWGDDFRRWTGRESLGIPVCKKKYAPFAFRIVREEGGATKVVVERVFGCHIHNKIRKAVIEEYGCRKGWEPYGQWSIKKALEKAKRETERLNSLGDDGETSVESWSSDDEKNAMSLCHNGNCLWRVKEK